MLYSFSGAGPWRPFVGAGVGALVIDINNLGAVGGAFKTNDSDTALLLMGHAGIDYQLSKTVALTARYTAAWMSKTTFQSTPAGTPRSVDSQLINGVSLGVRFLFD